MAKWNGKPIGTNGIFDAIPMDTYHGQLTVGPSVSSSGLRTIMNLSPAHYFADSYLNPDPEEDEDETAESAAFILGRAAHHLLLGEDDFSTHFIMRPEEHLGKPWHSNRTECRAWLKHQADEGRTVLTPKQVRTIRGMARSLAKAPLVQAGILNGQIEQSLVWKDKETGVWLKARPDAIPNDSGDFGDLKTAHSVTDDAIRKAIYEHGYHQQAALLAEGWEVLTGNKMLSFSLIFVEKKAPYCTRIITLKDGDLDRGRRQNRIAINIFANCLKVREWPGPGAADAEYMEMPSWAQSRIDGQLQFFEKG